MKERTSLRNIMTAQQSRLKDKFEVKFLTQIIESKEENIKQFVDIVSRLLHESGQRVLLADILKESQREIDPADNKVQDEFKSIPTILDCNVDVRTKITKLDGRVHRISPQRFINGAMELLGTG